MSTDCLLSSPSFFPQRQSCLQASQGDEDALLLIRDGLLEKCWLVGLWFWVGGWVLGGGRCPDVSNDPRLTPSGRLVIIYFIPFIKPQKFLVLRPTNSRDFFPYSQFQKRSWEQGCCCGLPIIRNSVTQFDKYCSSTQINRRCPKDILEDLVFSKQALVDNH